MEDPGPREDLAEEPSHPWAHAPSSHERALQGNRKEFDWDKERERQKLENAPFVESDEDREERLRSILP